MDSAVNKAFLKFYVYYSIAIGVTSQRLVKKKIKSSSFTRIYAWVVNILMLVLLPIFLWQSYDFLRAKSTLPWLILTTFDVRRLVTLFIIFYSILSRVPRDKALKKILPVLARLVHNKRLAEKRYVTPTLMVLFYAKCFTLSVIFFADFFVVFHELGTKDWSSFLKFLILINSHNIIFIMPMAYFLILWRIAGGFIYVDHQMDELIKAPRRDLEEVKRLWSLHADLSKASLRVNRIYCLQILAIRLDTFVFAVVEMYWGTFFTFSLNTPILWLVYGGVIYCTRLGDFFLIDYMCDLLARYQRLTKDPWTECDYRKEVRTIVGSFKIFISSRFPQTSAFITYVSSFKLELWTCGFYKADRKLWFQMIINIFNHFLVLLQFHLVLRKICQS
ncbi:hypothetical protein KR074_005049 [Drosophila pseudoananassae]|nr:hypothetical protein KR074_005049 [Drosophila pseudoananassae]